MAKVRITYLVPRDEWNPAEFLGEWTVVDTIADVMVVHEDLDLDALCGDEDADPGLELTEIIGGTHFHQMSRVY